MKKSICLLLAFFLLAVTFCACNGKNSTGKTTESAEMSLETEEETLPIKVEQYGSENTPENYTMLVRTNRYDYLYWDTANTSDSVQLKTFERNSAIEELYNISFNIVQTEGATPFSQKLMTADVGSYDLVCWDYWYQLEQGGYFVNLQELNDIDLSAKWWYQGWNENVTINGKTFSAVGDASLEVLQNLEVLFFNKNVANQRQLDLYKTVEDNQWTVAKLMSVNKEVAQNLDDDNPSNDFWGALYDVHSMRSALFSAGMKLCGISGEGGMITVAPDRSQIINSSDLVTSLIHSTEVNYSTDTARIRDYHLFTDEKALFFASCLLLGKNMKALGLGFDYGVIPAPKYDEESDYISTSYGASVFSIPKSCDNYDRAAVILTALNYFSNDTIVYNFYEDVLKRRVADMPEDAEMIDFARECLYVDFAFVNESTLGIFSAVQNSVVDGNSVSTTLGSFVKVANNALTELIAVYQQQ